jgi:hypothetical protein
MSGSLTGAEGAGDRSATEAALDPKQEDPSEEAAQARRIGREARIERREKVTEQFPDLALKLENPLARIVVLPVLVDVDLGSGANGKTTTTLVKFSPTYPFELNPGLFLISTTIAQWVDVDPGLSGPSISGFADLGQSFLFSPNKPVVKGIFWGLGPMVVMPTATEDAFGSGKWSIGPAFGLIKQVKPWTFGLLGNHIWSVAGDGSRPAVNESLLRPVVSVTTGRSTSLRLSAEARFDWISDLWRLPVDLTLSQLVLIRKHPIKLEVGLRAFAVRQTNGPNWGLRFQIKVPLRKN